MKRIGISILMIFALAACGNSTKPEPKPTPTTEPNITIAFGGDTNGVEHLSKFLNDGGDPFEGVASVLKKADISVLNLETAVTTQTAHQFKQYFFNSNPLILDKAAAAGVRSSNHKEAVFKIAKSWLIACSKFGRTTLTITSRPSAKVAVCT